MILPEAFEIRSGFGSIGGMTVDIARGPKSNLGAARLHLTDTAYGFIEPILKRVAPRYHPDTRFGIGEFDADVWRQALPELRSLAARLDAGEALTPSDIVWIPTYDEDDNVVTDTDAFLWQMNAPEARKLLESFLISIAEWIEASLEHEAVLTVYGY